MARPSLGQRDTRLRRHPQLRKVAILRRRSTSEKTLRAEKQHYSLIRGAIMSRIFIASASSVNGFVTICMPGSRKLEEPVACSAYNKLS